LPDPSAHRPHPGAMGPSEVQVLEAASATITAMAGAHRGPPAGSVRSLAPPATTRPNNGSRMRRQSHVRFCESAGVKLPRATHLVMGFEHESEARKMAA